MSIPSLSTDPDFQSPLTDVLRTRDPWREVADALLARIGETLALAQIRVLAAGVADDAAPSGERLLLVWTAASGADLTEAAARLSWPVQANGRNWGRIEFTDSRTDRIWGPRETGEAAALAGLIASAAGGGNLGLLARLLDAVAVPALVVDLHQRVRHANPAAEVLLGHAAGTLAGAPLGTVLDMPSGYGSRIGRTRAADGGTELLIRSGRLEPDGLTVLSLARRTGDDVAAGDDLLLSLAFQDRATGLPNRNYLAHAGLSGDTVIAIRLLERLGADTGGEEDGPSPIAVVVDQVKAAIGGRSDLLVRSSESGLAVVTTADPDTALELARAIRVPFKGPLRVGERRIPVQISIGIAQGPRPLPQLLQDAEFACHPERAGAIHRFETALRTRLQDRQSLEVDLRTALRLGDSGLSIAFQPTVALASGLLVGFEVLARWHHPARGLISPAVFVPLAESAGLMIALGTRVLDLAARCVQRWNEGRAARGLAPVFVSANLSSHQLMDPELLGVLGGIVSRTRVAPGHLRLEMTEATLMERPAQTATTLAAISRLGIGLSIDDFGHGPSTLGHLHRFGVDALKIDRQFVAGITRTEKEKTVLAGLIGLARHLGLEPVAEGIETPQVAEALVEMGCALGQGFLFGRPMSLEDAETLVLPPAP